MTAVRSVYRVIRSVLFATVITVAAIIVLLYLSLSIPAIHNRVRDVAEKELTAFMKAPVQIGRVELWPFNEVRLSDVKFMTPSGQECIGIDRLGAGIGFWKLVLQGKIEITYAEIIGMNALIEQPAKDAPLNIAFIVEAFKPNKKGMPPAIFDIRLHNVVIRKSVVAYRRLWIPQKEAGIDFNHIELRDLCADLAMPRLKNDDYELNLKRLSFREKSGLYVNALSFRAGLTPRQIWLRNFKLNLENTKLRLSDLELDINGYGSIPDRLANADYDITLSVDKMVPGEMAFFYPLLSDVPGKYNIKAQVSGNLQDISIRNFTLHESSDLLDISLRGNVRGLPEIKKITAVFPEFELSCVPELMQVIPELIPGLDNDSKRIIANVGMVDVNLKGGISLDNKRGYADGFVSTSRGVVKLVGNIGWADKRIAGNVDVDTEVFDVAGLIENSPVKKIALSLTGNVSVPIKALRESSGNITADVPVLVLEKGVLENINIELSRAGKNLSLEAGVDCSAVSGTVSGDVVLAGAASVWNINAGVNHFNASDLGLGSRYFSSLSVRNVSANLTGDDIENITGMARVDDMQVLSQDNRWNLSALGVMLAADGEERRITLDSDMVDAEVKGIFKIKDLPSIVTGNLAHSLPAYIKAPAHAATSQADLAYSVTIKDSPVLYDALHLPVTPEAPVRVFGNIDNSLITANISAPYLLKGDKLFKEISACLQTSIANGISVNAHGKFPGKNNYVNAEVSAKALDNHIDTELNWNFDNSADCGYVSIGIDVDKDDANKPRYGFDVKDADIVINGSKWDMSPAHAEFGGKLLKVDNLRIGNGNQYIAIDGQASDLPGDTIAVTLSDIDLAYIFNTLNINYVTFGGMASGRALASQIFGNSPVLETHGLHARNFSYNNAILGDADLSGKWNNTEKAVHIGADIRNEEGRSTTVDGDIFVTRDSLSLSFDADRVNLALIQPFLSNILEDVRGKASGQLMLYGTFKDITLVGKAKADDAEVRIGYTNVTYHGADSVIFYKDCISIPGFKVYDRYGNTAMFEGTVRHDYFHNAMIDLRVRDIDKILALDTDSRDNTIYWGHVFASGAGYINGRPGYTMLGFNATTEPGSSFTFALDETLTAEEYNFLTFTDSHKQELKLSVEEEFEEKYKKKQENDAEDESIFEMDMSINITPSIKMNVIMDPAAGDKITATGSGAMRMHYNTFSDNLDIYGRYTLNQGKYRFSFQDIILRDFTIRQGSTISFNGDPMRGILDLTAAYRVNTNLTDLDKSFATDRDLNRSSIPVEALLKVAGELQSPDISFDLSLPTMTSDVERKVRSIVSSEEMLQQQVLYLLALNRFYTPQFAGNSDGELVSVASSTLSSQVANALSQVTDKFTLSPSFKSDRNDFSDMEVDLALSSQLFDNRLIINGNLGYRDRSVSQSTFIGDFDLEYLLSKDGRLRLKAYNHFNDAYYYLKSALTTQGVGIIYRQDFDDPFAFLKHKRKQKDKSKIEGVDTIQAVKPDDAVEVPSVNNGNNNGNKNNGRHGTMTF